MTKITKVLDGVTATTTSSPVNIKGARKVTILCQRADHSSGSSAFTASVGVGTSYAAYNRFITNVTNTNAQTPVRAAGVTLSADGLDFVTMSPEDAFEFIKVTVTEATDGTHSAWVIAEFENEE